MGHTFSNILLHIVFGTRRRMPYIEERFRSRLYEYMAGVARTEFGKALIIGGTSDHIHALISLKPDVSVSDAMRKWKSLSSGWIHQTFSEHEEFEWQEGYGCFSVSKSNMDILYKYIKGQEEHHKRRSFEEEFRLLLERNSAISIS